MRDINTGRFLPSEITYEINENGCWMCTSHKTHHTGYVIKRFGNNLKLLHRYMYEQKYGTIPNGLLACHTCDVRNCINPDHIFIGTQKDNMRDCSSKGRSGPRLGKNQYS